MFCWILEFRRDVIQLKELKFQSYMHNECTTGKPDWIWKNCHDFMLKNKMSMQAKLGTFS